MGDRPEILRIAASVASVRALAVLAAAALSLAAHALAVPTAAEAKQSEQLRGMMLSPNWENPPPAGASPAELAREVAAACGAGADVVRLAVTWARLEPAPGHFDPAYAATVDHV